MVTYYVFVVETGEIIKTLPAPEGLDKAEIVRRFGYGTGAMIFACYEIDDGGLWSIHGDSKDYYLWWDEFGVTTSTDGLFLCF